ncbi:hypothetical protein [Nitrosopumilus ureiphilus]|nr:hypothetical protein [Nitrosopumilus ureiphilus]
MATIPEIGTGHSFEYSDGSKGTSFDNAKTIHENAETYITSQFPIV